MLKEIKNNVYNALFVAADVINQYDGSGCRPYIIDNDRRRAYMEVVEL